MMLLLSRVLHWNCHQSIYSLGLFAAGGGGDFHAQTEAEQPNQRPKTPVSIQSTVQTISRSEINNIGPRLIPDPPPPEETSDTVHVHNATTGILNNPFPPGGDTQQAPSADQIYRQSRFDDPLLRKQGDSSSIAHPPHPPSVPHVHPRSFQQGRPSPPRAPQSMYPHPHLRHRPPIPHPPPQPPSVAQVCRFIYINAPLSSSLRFFRLLLHLMVSHRRLH